MRKKTIEEYREKSIVELEKIRSQLVKDIALAKLESKVNPPKDTNTLLKKRMSLAILETILQEKKTSEVKK